MMMTTVFSKAERAYTGVELRPHFLLSELGLKGSGIGAFIGPCRVSTEHLVDWEDRLAADRIEARWMVHFIGEFFGTPALREGVLLQRLLMAILCDEVNARLLTVGASRCRREGDDLFVGDRKLSVSIVTASPVSLLLHIGINIDPAGAPVPALGLGELGILPDEWVPAVLGRMEEELRSVEWACAKVRPVL
ncbi:MAG: DUF366 family protein [Oligoflexia bacterium]|nr:DUF366 family protein [Oligoflexia bacterium]